MTKIAEAWEKLERAQLRVEAKHAAYLQPGVTSEAIIAYDDAVDDERAAVHALALAVLDEAEREASEHVSDFLLDKDDLGFADWTLHLDALREEINKLGGEVDA